MLNALFIGLICFAVVRIIYCTNKLRTTNRDAERLVSIIGIVGNTLTLFLSIYGLCI